MSATNGLLAGNPTAPSSLSPLLQRAVQLLPPDDRDRAAKVAVLSEAGMKDMEIARSLGLTWRKLEALRERLRAGVVEALRCDGCGDGEIVRTLGLPTQRVAELRLAHSPTCMVAMSGEPGAVCTCDRGGAG